MDLRPAEPNDLDAFALFSRQARHRRAEWAPVYFRPGADADELQPLFLEFMIGSEDHHTFTIVDDGEPVGFFVRIPQQRRVWLDDLVVADDSRWSAVLELILATETEPWITCVASLDAVQLAAMASVNMRCESRYFARLVDGVSPTSNATDPESINDDPRRAALHTFGTLSPTTEGALVIGDAAGGYLVGSPSVIPPPIYDPGGPTPVIDRVVGEDRQGLIESACAVAAGRGDAQLVVVCDSQDFELEKILLGLGFNPVVDMMGTPHGCAI